MRKCWRGLGQKRQFGRNRARRWLIANPYTFTGRRFDEETGLYYYRNRYYHAQLGRFVSRDPIGYEGSEWNLYEYVASNPLVATDPLGLILDSVSGAIRACMALPTATARLKCLKDLAGINPTNQRIKSLIVQKDDS